MKEIAEDSSPCGIVAAVHPSSVFRLRVQLGSQIGCFFVTFVFSPLGSARLHAAARALVLASTLQTIHCCSPHLFLPAWHRLRQAPGEAQALLASRPFWPHWPAATILHAFTAFFTLGSQCSDSSFIYLQALWVYSRQGMYALSLEWWGDSLLWTWTSAHKQLT